MQKGKINVHLVDTTEWSIFCISDQEKVISFIALCLRDTLRSNGWPYYIYFQYRRLPSESARMNRRKKFFSSQQLRPKLLYIIHHWVSYTMDTGNCLIRPSVTEEWNWLLSPCPAKVNAWAIQLLALWRPSQSFTQFHGHRNQSHYWLHRSGRTTNTRYAKTFNWKAIGVPKQIYCTLFFIHHHSPSYRFESDASTFLNSTEKSNKSYIFFYNIFIYHPKLHHLRTSPELVLFPRSKLVQPRCCRYRRLRNKVKQKKKCSRMTRSSYKVSWKFFGCLDRYQGRIR